MQGSSTALRTVARDVPKAPTADLIATEHGDGLDRSTASARLRSGAWPRQVKVEITRIENRLRVALVGNTCPRRQAVANATRR